MVLIRKLIDFVQNQALLFINYLYLELQIDLKVNKIYDLKFWMGKIGLEEVKLY